MDEDELVRGGGLTVDPLLASTLEPWLERRERLLWTARPDARRLARRRLPGAVIALVLIAGGALLALGLPFVAPSSGGGPGPASIPDGLQRLQASLRGMGADETFSAGVLALLAAAVLWLALLRPALGPRRARRRARHTLYALSNRRLMTLVETSFTDYDLRTFRSVTVDDPTPDGLGDLVVRRVVGMHSAVLPAVPDAASVAAHIAARMAQRHGGR